MAPGQPAVLPLALIRSGLEEQEGPGIPAPVRTCREPLAKSFVPLPLVSSSGEQGLAHTP